MCDGFHVHVFWVNLGEQNCVKYTLAYKSDTLAALTVWFHHNYAAILNVTSPIKVVTQQQKLIKSFLKMMFAGFDELPYECPTKKCFWCSVHGHSSSISNRCRVIGACWWCRNRPETEIAARWHRQAEVIGPFDGPIWNHRFWSLWFSWLSPLVSEFLTSFCDFPKSNRKW